MKKTNILLTIVSIMTFLSCHRTDFSNKTDFSNPSDVIKNYINLSLNNKNDSLYEDYLSIKSKEFVTKDEFIKSHKIPDSTFRSTKNLETKISSFPVDINNPSYRRFKIDEKKIVKSDTIYSRLYYTLANENGKWKVLWIETLFSFGFEKYNGGNYSEARKTLEKIIEINPFDGKVYTILAWCYLRDNTLTKNERENGIVKNAKYAVTLEEDNPYHYNTLANYYSSTGNSDLAIQNFERGLNYCQNKEDKTIFYSNLAGVYIDIGKNEKAEEYIKKSIEIDDKDAFTWYIYGGVMKAENKITEAIGYFERALKEQKMENSLQGRLYYFYADCCLKKNKCEVAREYINKALDIDPNNDKYQSLYNKIKHCKLSTN